MTIPYDRRDRGADGDDFTPRTAKDFAAYLARRQSVFFLAYVGYVSCYLVRNNVKVVSDVLSREHGWSPTQIGLVLTGFTIAYGFGKFVMGIVADRMSLRTIFAAALGISAILCILMGVFPDLGFYFVAMSLIGIVQGACAPAALSVVGGWYPNQLRGSRVAVWNTSQNVGAGMLPLLVSGSLGLVGPSNWSVAFWLPGLIALAASWWYWNAGGDRPWRENYPTLSEMFGPLGTPQLPTERTQSYWSVMRNEVLTSRLILVVAVINTLLYFVRFGIVNWIPIYLARERGFTLEETSIVFGVLEWSAIPGSLLFALIARRWPNRMALVGSLCIALLGATIAVYATSGDFTTIVVLAVALGAFTYGPQIIVNIMTLNFVSARVAGVAVGFVGLGGYVIGETGANLVLPALAENFGWSASYATLVVGCGICAVLYATLRRSEREIVRI